MTPEEARKIYFNKWYKILKDEYVAQDVWNYMRSYSLDVPVGYELKIWRLNSTKLPVTVDLRYKTACNASKSVPYKKWFYSNALFWVKAANPNRKLEGPYIHFVVPQTEYNGPTERAYFKTISKSRKNEFEKKRGTKALSRSDYKRLKKQRECKSIAEKGSLER